MRMQLNTEKLIEHNDIKEKYIQKLIERLTNTNEQDEGLKQEIEGKRGELKAIISDTAKEVLEIKKEINGNETGI